jgi:hypothetical protein
LNYRKAWIKEAVDMTWGSTGFKFIGWGDCNENSPGIRITTSGVHGDWTAALGKNLNGVPSGVEIALDIPKAMIDALQDTDPRKLVLKKCLASEENMKNCVNFSAVHEFGHALGLEHEQNRSDVDRPCDTNMPFGPLIPSPRYGDQGDVTFGRYDGQSIMNYCRIMNAAAMPTLSQLDKDGVLAFYRGDAGVQEIGRPLVTMNQGEFENAPSLLPDALASFIILFPFVKDSSLLPDPRGNPKAALAMVIGPGKREFASCGEWINDSSFTIGKKTICTWSPPLNWVGSRLNLIWNGKFSKSVEIANSVAQFPEPQNGKLGQILKVELSVGLKPGTETPDVSITGNYYPSSDAIIFSKPTCNKISESKALCAANSTEPLTASGTILLTGKLNYRGSALPDVGGYATSR